jgi:hypothetical protein
MVMRDRRGGRPLRVTVHDTQDADCPFTIVAIAFGDGAKRAGRTFWLATRDVERVADHFVSLPVPHVSAARVQGFCAFTPEGELAVISLNDVERNALEECLVREFGQ